MAVLRWDPWGELAALQRDVHQLLGQTPATRTAAGLIPPIDAYRTDEGLVVRVELAGLRPDEVEVAVNDGMLTVSGERKFDADISDEAWLRRERATGRFERSFGLPEGTDPAGIQANFNHGLLELRIPHPPQRRPHRVEIGSDRGDAQTLQVEEQARQ